MMKEKQNALRVRPVVGNTHTHTFERNRAETRNFTNREGAKTGQIKIKNEEGGERGKLTGVGAAAVCVQLGRAVEVEHPGASLSPRRKHTLKSWNLEQRPRVCV